MVEKNKRLKILVIGAAGLLGSELMRLLTRVFSPYDVKGTTHTELDITKGKEVAICLERLHPNIIINCAALSNVDDCEKWPEDAFRVNAEGIKNICLPLVEDVKARLIHISTDYVFDGRKKTPYVEMDTVNPLSVYGESKLKGETYVEKLLPDAVILRVQWLYGSHGKSFASRMVQAVTRGDFRQRYCLIEDRVGNPTSVTELAKAIEALIVKQNINERLYHLSAEGSSSWVEFGKTIFKINGINDAEPYIQMVKEKNMNRLAKRPPYSVFSSVRFEQEIGFKMPPWQEQLKEVIGRLYEERNKS